MFKVLTRYEIHYVVSTNEPCHRTCITEDKFFLGICFSSRTFTAKCYGDPLSRTTEWTFYEGSKKSHNIMPDKMFDNLVWHMKTFGVKK